MPDGPKLTVDGLRDTVTAWRSVITADAVFEGSAILVAVIVMLWVVGAVLAATNTADVVVLDKLPKSGFNDHVTPVLLVPLTVAVNV